MRILLSCLVIAFCGVYALLVGFSSPANATTTAKNPQKVLAQTLLFHQQEVQYTQAKLAYTDNPTPQQVESIAKQVYALAQAGYAPAQYTMGQFLRKGVGGVQQPAYARFWYHAAAMQQHPQALWQVALCYQQGVGGLPDALKALGWFEATAKASSPYTSKALWNASALHWHQQTGRLQTMEKQWLTLATLGDTEAKSNLGVLYLNTPTKARLGLQYLQQASSAGNLIAKAHLGSWLYQQPKVKPEGLTQAVLLLNQSAKAGVGLGQCNLGQYYYQKRFVPAYAKLAFSWLMVAKTQHPEWVVKTKPLLAHLTPMIPPIERQSLTQSAQTKRFPAESFPLKGSTQAKETLPARFSTVEGFQFKLYSQYETADF
jgi:TPR repeat protein